MGFDPATLAMIAAISSTVTSLGGMGLSIYQATQGQEAMAPIEPPDLSGIDAGAEEKKAKRRKALAQMYGREETDITGGRNVFGNVMKRRLGAVA